MKLMSLLATWAVAAFSLSCLAGHLLGIPRLSHLGAATPVPAATALSLGLLAISVQLQRGPGRVAAARLLAVIAIAIVGVASFGGIAALGQPTRLIASTLVVIALAVLVLQHPASDWLALIPGAIGLVGVAGQLWAATFASPAYSEPVAAYAGVLGIALSVMMARPGTGLTRPLALEGPPGVMARRILPAAIIVALVTVWIRLEAQESGMLGTQSGAGFLAVGFIVTLTVLTHQTALALEVSDVERTRAEAATQEAESRYREMFSQAPVGLFRALPDGTLLERNAALARLLGEAIDPDSRAFNLFDLLLDAAHRDYLRARLRRSEPVFGVEVQVRRADGAPAWVQLTAAPVAVPGMPTPPYVQGAMLDLTTRRRLEQDLAQAQKLEALGRLAGGIAHDFNNLLTVVNAGSGFVLETLAEDDPRREDLTEIIGATRRAAELTQQLLAYSRQQVLTPRALDLNGIIEGVAGLLRRTLGEDVELVTLLSDDLGQVMADRVRLEQVLLNLAINARDAMPGGGRLTIATSATTLDESYTTEHHDVVPGEFVLLSVSDTGEGMDDATRLRIFDPFFTTKAAGRGTGLGLATVQGIIRQSHGHIWVYSEPGEGTTFKVYLPRTGLPVEADPPPAVAEPPAGTGRILLVEDDETVRRLVERMLRTLGYEVIIAAGAEEALAIAADHQISFDLVLTDVIMPGHSGRLLVDLLRRHRQFAVVFMSGYTDDDVLRYGIERRAVHFLQKPFTIEALGSMLQAALRGRAPGEPGEFSQPAST